MTRREEVIQGLVKGGMSREEASKLVKALCEEYKSIGWREGHDEGLEDGYYNAL
jgi:hypothetical protein